MNSEIFEKIYQKHIKLLKNLNIENNKRITICFSDVPRFGKTIIAKKLEERYKAIRICNDDVRDTVKELRLEDMDEQEIVETYFFWLLDKIKKYPNKLIIVDSSIDREYKKVFPVAKENNYKIFTIQIDTDEDIFKQRAFNNKDLLDRMEKLYNEHKNFVNNNKSDFILKNNFDLDLKELYKELDSFLGT